MPGPAVRPDDGRRKNRGGSHGGGRPFGWRKKDGVRDAHQIRAYPKEWILTKEFMLMTRIDPELCEETIRELREKIPSWGEKVAPKIMFSMGVTV